MQHVGGKVLEKNLVEWAAQSLYKYAIPNHAILNHIKPCNTKPYQAMQYVGGKVLGKNWAQSLYKYTIPKHAITGHAICRWKRFG